MSERYFYEPARGHGLPHDPFNAIVGPRPIGWISSRGEQGLNLAPYSFFNAFNYTPPLIGFASIGRKDTLRNIERHGEFVWNLATRPLAEAMNASCAPAPSRVVDVPRVAESPVSFECRRSQIIRLQSAAGVETDSWLVLGEVVGVHIAQELLRDGIYDTAAAHPILRAGGPADYFEITADNRFQMRRPAYP